MTKQLEGHESPSERWTLLRDLGVFQVKLIADGLRDLILVPTSLIAGIVSLVKSENGRPGLQFYHLLGFGQQTERWINLFGAVENSPEKLDLPTPFGESDIDDLMDKFESFVVDEFKRGGLTTQAKERLHAALEAIQRKNRDSL
jgi:hypothetical protein